MEKEGLPMAKDIIMFDSNSELPWELQEQFHAPYVGMPYILNDEEKAYDLGKQTDIKAFYDQVRAGNLPKTNTLPPSYYEEFWRPMLQAGSNILFIMFSSGLSGAYDLVTMARENILKEFPERKIILVDTRSISMGCGLLVYYALNMFHSGSSIEEVAQWLEDNKMRVNHWFVVDDLMHLYRGGRLSATSAIFGSILEVKPVLTVNREGKLQPVEKIKGKKKVIRRMTQIVAERVENPEEQVCVILHADSEEAARQLEASIREQGIPFKDIWVRWVGPVIGSHAGPGTLAVLFMGKERDQ